MLKESPAPPGPTPAWRRQFGHPQGVMGWAVGHLMALKNGERSQWVRSLLDVAPNDHVLEIGFGPGVDIEWLSARSAFVGGVDVSDEMVRQASRRNARAISEGRVALACGAAEAIPFPAARFDKVFSINAVQFWRDLPAALAEIRRVLRPSGLAAIAIQPRDRGATAATSAAWGSKLADALGAAGLRGARIEESAIGPVPIVCALAYA
jgi:ubiquinone/menaquinone biosynthesis C-methylase UbiE